MLSIVQPDVICVTHVLLELCLLLNPLNIHCNLLMQVAGEDYTWDIHFAISHMAQVRQPFKCILESLDHQFTVLVAVYSLPGNSFLKWWFLFLSELGSPTANRNCCYLLFPITHCWTSWPHLLSTYWWASYSRIWPIKRCLNFDRRSEM